MGRSVHHIPGRIRFKISDLRDSSTLAQALCKGLESISGVKWVEIRPASSSLIVHYEPRLTDVKALVAFIEGEEVRAHGETVNALIDLINADNTVAKSVRHIGVVFGKTAFRVALEQVVMGGFRAAMART